MSKSDELTTDELNKLWCGVLEKVKGESLVYQKALEEIAQKLHLFLLKVYVKQSLQ